MAITVNGAVLRNMPEQISKNVEDIADIQTTSENHETRITALENDAIALATFQDCTFTGTSEFQGNINQTSGNLAIQNNASINGNATIGGTFNANGVSYLKATTITGNLTASGTVTASGDLSVAVDASVAGDLAVTGAITGGSIIENMSNYSAAIPAATLTDYEIENAYVSVVKTGNKITFVTACDITKKTGASENSPTIVTFYIPSEIWNKLYTSSLAGAQFLDNKVIPIFKAYNDYIEIICDCEKGATGRIYMIGRLANAVEETKYYFRYEVTFLLSDNLIAS